MDAAIRLIATRGLRGTTLGDVGLAAGYSRGLAAHHYKSKDGLIRAVAAEIHARFQRRLASVPPQPDGLELLLTGIRLYLDQQDVPATRALILLQKEGLTEQSEYRDTLQHINRSAVKWAKKQIETGIAKGEIIADIDPHTQATLLLAMLRGVRSMWVAAPKEVDLKSVTAEVIGYVRKSLAMPA